jgi:hypothetical protein
MNVTACLALWLRSTPRPMQALMMRLTAEKGLAEQVAALAQRLDMVQRKSASAFSAEQGAQRALTFA